MPLSGLLVFVTSVATAGQAATDEETARRTTEIPGSGVGVTLPVAWRIASVSPEGGGQNVILANDIEGRRSCSFRLLADVDSVEGAAERTVELVEGQGRYEVVERALLNLQPGAAIRVAYRFDDAPDDARFVLDEYYLAVPGGVVSAHCQGEEPPADRWLSVIEAIAPLTADPPSAAPFEPRVEVTAHGFALDFPAEWLVRWWPGPGPALGGDLILRAVTLVGDDGHDGYECLLEDDTVLLDRPDADSLEAWRAILIAYAEARGRRTSDPVVTGVDLPSGRAVRADWQRWRGEPATAWVYLASDGKAAAALLCRSAEPPDDGWGSIAESFEFLPTSE